MSLGKNNIKILMKFHYIFRLFKGSSHFINFKKKIKKIEAEGILCGVDDFFTIFHIKKL